MAVIAPHGGTIEPGTSAIAREIACDDHALYCFEGVIPSRPHSDLHITSTDFDEPLGCALVADASVVVAIHGRLDGSDRETIWLGGLDAPLVQFLATELAAAGFKTWVSDGPLAGRDRGNICNRGKSGAGVQLELPRTLRDALQGDAVFLGRFARAARSAITLHIGSASIE